MFVRLIDFMSEAVWSIPTVALIALTGLWFTFRMRCPQISSFKEMICALRKNLFSGGKRRAIESISTALAATVGTGSVSGVATALTIGGPGAIFWLWISAFLGMAVAYAEGVLSIKYRDGKKGGIMYAICNGLKEPFAAAVYAAFTLLASFGMGSMAQTNAGAQAMSSEFSVQPVIIGTIFAIVAALCVFSRRDFTGKACSVFLLMLSLAYICVTLWVITVNYKSIPSAFESIFSSAFGIRPLTGGAAGYAVKQAISTGFKRGIFSNEAGLGTTAAIHAESEGISPHEQGLMNMFEVITDTFIICTLTALCILTSGAQGSGADGAELVTTACKTAFGDISGKIVAISICGFSLATVMGWSKIGLGAADYLGGKVRIALYKLAYVAAAFAGSVISLDTVWKISDIFNGMMIFPCTIALILLRKEIVRAKDDGYIRPVEPKPFSPRSESGSSSDSQTPGKITGVTTICANRSPGSKV